MRAVRDVWFMRARAELCTCILVDMFFHMQYHTPKYPVYPSKIPLFHIFKYFLCYIFFQLFSPISGPMVLSFSWNLALNGYIHTYTELQDYKSRW